jgi:hypothetical protein
MEQCLPRLLIVEGRVEPIWPQPALCPERIEKERLKVRVLFDLRDEVEWRFLPPIHLARCQGFRRLPRIRDVPPYHLVDVRLLAAGRAARRLVARKVVEVPHVHDLLTWLPLVPRELERPGADDLLNLLVCGGGRDPRRHHERHVARRLSKCLEHGTEAFGQLQRERLPVDGRNLPDMRHQ